jgi:FKBP-type peptidyl-prolyl cis-trans isomerase FkpA
VLLCLACGPVSTTNSTIETATFASSLGVDLTQSTRLASGEYVRDTGPGSGATLVAGQLLSVHYTGWLIDGTQFDSNQSPMAPFSFRLGNGDVIAGWDQGFDGMKVGGTRQLIIPPALGYGASGVGGVIPSNAILVFSVTAVSAQ